VANQAVEDAIRERERQEHEAMKSAELARQWKEYSEKVESQLKAREPEIAQAKEEAAELVKEEKAMRGGGGVQERQGVAKEGHGVRDDDFHDEELMLSRALWKQLVITITVSALFSYVVVFRTDMVVVPDDLSVAAMSSHIFFTVFCGINAMVASAKPDIGIGILCSPLSSAPAFGIVALNFGYLVVAGICFLRERHKFGWCTRLVQLCVVAVLFDFNVQTRAHCPIAGAKFSNSALPFFGGLVLYSMSMLLEIAVAKSWDGIESGGDGAERDRRLEALLFDIFMADRAWNGKKNEEGRRIWEEDEKKEAGGEGRVEGGGSGMKRRQQVGNRGIMQDF